MSDESKTDFGYADIMGPELRGEVERQLRADLGHYGSTAENLEFDWSETCIEGHREQWLDGVLEDFSGIGVQENDVHYAEGWMDFVVDRGDPPRLFVFWEFLTVRERPLKRTPGIPAHIWERLSLETRNVYADRREKIAPTLP